MLMGIRTLVHSSRTPQRRNKEQLRNLAEEDEDHFPTVSLDPSGAAISVQDPLISEEPTLTEVREAISKLKGGKAASICSISAELVKAREEPMAQSLHMVLASSWQSGSTRLLSFFPVNSEVRQSCVLAPTHFITCMGRAPIQSQSGATLGNTKVMDLDFANDITILFESLDSNTLVFNNIAKPLDLEVSWTKTKIQDFGGLLGELV
ncbi:uncharacterized protein [Penaeus vannamei]|uniref:uncharacterized protein n=1 Tax=Penaeus vannamei TaxID=6689 RepID=UPI00387F683B